MGDTTFDMNEASRVFRRDTWSRVERQVQNILVAVFTGDALVGL